MSEISPALWLLLGGLVSPLLSQRLRAALAVVLPLAVLGLVAALPDGVRGGVAWAGEEIVFLRVDLLSRLFALVFCLAAAAAGLYAARVRQKTEQSAALLYAGGAVGAVFAGDLLSFFLFWEVVGITPLLLILARGDASARRAAFHYALAQVLSGALLLAGIAQRGAAGLDLAVGPLPLADAGSVWILLALGIKCGWPLLNGWILAAYPAATPTGTVYLCVFTTKLAVYALVRCFAGVEALLWIGSILALLPLVFGLVTDDLRRTVCYAMLNQLGILTIGVGVGTKRALDGVAAQATAHVLYDTLLFMAYGVVISRTGRQKTTEVGGLLPVLPFAATCALLAGCAMGGLPLLAGYPPKSLITGALAEGGHLVAWLAVVLGSAGVFLLAALRLPMRTFLGPAGTAPSGPALRSEKAAMATLAVGCLLLGLFPNLLAPLLPHGSALHPWEGSHAYFQLSLLAGVAAVYVAIRRPGATLRLRARLLDTPDLDRGLVRSFERWVVHPFGRWAAGVGDGVQTRLPRALARFAHHPPGAMRLAFDRVVLAVAALTGSPARVAARQETLTADRQRFERLRPGTPWGAGAIILYSTIVFLLLLLFELL